ncbi:MAG: hypothetical protein KAJ64_07235 [Thermoplasmata archaeon]|nr:hypothetical protein [Thermoplasmata archaeon]
MDEEILKQVKAIVGNSTCPSGCKCYRLKRDEVCRARSTDLNNLLECLEESPENCSFSVAFGGSYFCKCRTRIELAKILGE